jgi:hypothetical protein
LHPQSKTKHKQTMAQPFAEVMKDYLTERQLQLSPDEFGMLLSLVPVMLVGTSDYTLDKVETEYLKDCTDVFATALQTKGTTPGRIAELQTIFKQEAEYLLEKLANWERRALLGLEEFLRGQPEYKELIRKYLEGMAAISKGVNRYEQDLLMDICFRLNIPLA